MPIVVNCPICGIRLSLTDDRAGSTMDCPKCDARMLIPGPPPPPPPMRPALQPVVRQLPPPDAEGDEEDDGVPIRRRRKPKRRYEDEEDDAGDRYRGFQCPYCGSRRRPYVTTQISPTGWVVFTLLLIFTVCLCFVGLFITEEVRRCRDCGMKLG